ncbi:MAG: ABC transporter substrate-binding protein [Candidatus Limivivens sp.]|nr:ABC transporter substrate-binding protein [Candidatus Limivivens sp.]
MKNRSKKLLALFCAAATFTSMTIPAMAAEGPDGIAVKDEINIAITAENAVYDLHKTTSNSSRVALCGTVYEQLMTLNGEGEPVPELCESYEVNEDATEFTFVLRQGVKFHDGSEMTADDVVASLNRWIGSYTAVQKLVGESRFEKTDDMTVSIKTENPCVTLLYLLAGGAQRAVITTEEALASEGEDGYMADIIGTGPYTFEEWELDQYVWLKKFEDYVPYGNAEELSDGWAGYKHAYTENIYLWVVPEEATRMAGLQTGQYDAANISDATLTQVEGNEDLKGYEEEGGQIAIVFNKKEGLCADQNMRKAINCFVDSDELLAVSYGSSYTLNSCYMDSFQSAWYSEAGAENYNTKDAEAGQSYLEAAGYNGETLRILVASANNFDKIAQILEQELENNGIDCEITTVDWGTFGEYRNDSSIYDLYITSFATVPVPSLKVYFGAEYAGWTSDEHLDELWSVYNNATTIEEATTAWVDVQEYCWDYLPIINLGHYVSHDVMNSQMEGVVYYNCNYFWNAYIPQ